MKCSIWKVFNCSWQACKIYRPEFMRESAREMSASLSCSKDKTWNWVRAWVLVCYTQWPDKIWSVSRWWTLRVVFKGWAEGRPFLAGGHVRFPQFFSIVLESVKQCHIGQIEDVLTPGPCPLRDPRVTLFSVPRPCAWLCCAVKLPREGCVIHTTTANCPLYRMPANKTNSFSSQRWLHHR